MYGAARASYERQVLRLFSGWCFVCSHCKIILHSIGSFYSIMQCPKCRSDQVLNDECLKCGVVISKYLKTHDPQDVPFASPTSSARMSVVIPEGVTNSYQLARRRSSRHTMIITAVILITVFGGGYSIYKHFKQQAAAYSGFYRQGHLSFTIKFPKEGWYHHYPDQLESIEVKDARDAFYRGSPDDPEILMAISSIYEENLNLENWNPKIEESMKKRLRKEILERYEKSGFVGEIMEVKSRGLGLNPGFMFSVDIINEVEKQSIVYCAMNKHTLLLFQILGKEESLSGYRNEIDGIMNTLSFEMSII